MKKNGIAFLVRFSNGAEKISFISRQVHFGKRSSDFG